MVLCTREVRSQRAGGVGLLLGTLAGSALVISLVVTDLAECCMGTGTV